MRRYFEVLLGTLRFKTRVWLGSSWAQLRLSLLPRPHIAILGAQGGYFWPGCIETLHKVLARIRLVKILYQEIVSHQWLEELAVQCKASAHPAEP